MENNIQTSQIPEQDQKPGIMSRIVMVFSEPSKLFATLTGKTDWLIPLIIIGLIGGIIGYQTRAIYAKDMYKGVVDRIDQYREQMPEAQFNRIMEDVDRQFAEAKENPFKWYYPPLWFGLPFVFWLIISVIALMSGNFIFGGKAGFWVIMNVIAYAALIGFAGDVLRGILILMKDSMYVYTGLGLLKPANDGSFLFYLFRQIDIFSVWRIIVTSIGLGVIYKMNSKKFAIVLLLFWLIFIALIAFANQFTGGTIIY